MANITRFDPFNEMDDLFKGLFVRPMRFDLEMPVEMKLKMDVTKADDSYTVKAEMPGIKKEDIQVSIDGNQVTISGEVKKESEEKKGEEIIRSERYYGKVSRSFTLPHEVDEAKAVAKLLSAFGGKGFFAGDVTFLALGQVEDLWDEVAIAMYPKRADLLRMSSSEEWQKIAVHRTAGLAGQLNIETVAQPGAFGWLGAEPSAGSMLFSQNR